jgi:uncharacterized protein (DUF433 family)
MDYKQFIEIHPKIRFGKPCIKGTRISVYDILSLFASGMTSKEILVEHPQLNKDQISACVAFSADRERRATIVVIPEKTK